MVRGLLSSPEVTKLRQCMEESEDIKRYAYGRNDSLGRQSKMCIWNYAGNDVTGVVARYVSIPKDILITRKHVILVA